MPPMGMGKKAASSVSRTAAVKSHVVPAKKVAQSAFKKTASTAYKKAGGVAGISQKLLQAFDVARPLLGLIPGSEKGLAIADATRETVGIFGGKRYESPYQRAGRLGISTQYNDGLMHANMQLQGVSDNASGAETLTPISSTFVSFSSQEAGYGTDPISLPGGPSNFPHPSLYFPNAGSSANYANVGQNDYRGAPGFFASSYGNNAAPSARGYSSLASGSSTGLFNPSVYDSNYSLDFEPEDGFYQETPDYSNFVDTYYD